MRARQKVQVRSALRREVHRRDGYACQLCGIVGREEHRSRRDGWRTNGYRFPTLDGSTYLSVDHIVPRSKGGSDEPSNLRTLCHPCNARKGTKAEALS